MEEVSELSSGQARWVPGPGVVCYNEPPQTKVDRSLYDEMRLSALAGVAVEDFEVPAREGRSWEMLRGDLCRVSLVSGSQVGDINMWNLHDSRERLYAAKTRQLHSAHLSVYDRLWSSLPYLRPLATVVGDTIRYGVDPDGAGVHDVLGTRCDPYTWRMLGGGGGGGAQKQEDCEKERVSCHGNLVKAVAARGLREEDVHDVWNIFMCTRLERGTNRYFCKASPARKGDYIEFIADMDLLVALSACPQGDVSTPVGESVPPDRCFPLRVQTFRVTSVDT